MPSPSRTGPLPALRLPVWSILIILAGAVVVGITLSGILALVALTLFATGYWLIGYRSLLRFRLAVLRGNSKPYDR